MGLFKDAYDVGAGATLGSLTTQSLYQMGGMLVNRKFDQAYLNYRCKNFDPIVRTDLRDIIVKGSLAKIDNPFPKAKGSTKIDFFKRHRILTIILILYILLSYFNFNFKNGSITSENIGLKVLMLTVIIFFLIILRIFSRVGRAVKGTYKTSLDNDGEQYWYIREYIRQALDAGELTVKEAILKISNTNLGQQFPDTIEEIEANAFYYKQRLGL